MISDEMTRIEGIRKRLDLPHEGIVLGIGDDAAVLAPSAAAQVVSVDAAVEDVHFRRSFTPLRALGRRALMAAASDLAAMGARPRCAVLSLTLPDRLCDDDLYALVDGLADAARELAMPIVGGNLSAGPALAVHSTVIGEIDGAPLRRRGAREGDGIFVTSVVGSAALGLELLLRERVDVRNAEPFLRAWTHPSAEIDNGLRLRGRASAVIDVSDGLVQDLGHICDASGVGARIETARLPRLPHFDDVCRALEVDALALQLQGGEQYCLLFTASGEDAHTVPCTKIGVITAGAGVVALDAQGSPVEVHDGGYRHFRRA